MVSYVELQNFKSFSHVFFDLRGAHGIPKKMALLYGENGSGKSNLIRSLTFIGQSFDTFKNRQELSNIDISPFDVLKDEELKEKVLSEIIRKRIGFKGLLISDSIDMNALHGSILERANNSLDAGCDVFCYCMGQPEQLELLCNNVRFLSDDAMLKFEKIKNVLQIKKKSIQSKQVRSKYFEAVKKFATDEINYDATETLHQMQKGEK